MSNTLAVAAKPIEQSAKATLQAIALLTFAMAAFGLADSLIRLASLSEGGRASAGQLLSLQGLIGFLFFRFLMLRRNLNFTKELVSNRYVLIRSTSDVIAASCIMTALTLMPVGDLSAIMQVQPLMVTLGAVLFLGEKVGIYRWSAIIVGFIGVSIIMRPAPGNFEFVSLLVLLGVAALSSRDLSTRLLPQHLSTISIIAFVSLLLIPTGLTLHALNETNGVFDIGSTAFAIGLISSSVAIIGYYALTLAMRMGEVSAIAPYRYTRLIFVFIFAWILLGEVPDRWTVFGAVIVISAGINVIYRERKLQNSTNKK